MVIQKYFLEKTYDHPPQECYEEALQNDHFSRLRSLLTLVYMSVYTGVYQKGDEKVFIHEVCFALENAGVPYAVVGGYAVALHGVVRGTVDVDIAIQWSLKNLQNAENAFKQLGLVSLIPITAENLFQFREEYIQNRNLIAWNFYDPSNPIHQVDIVINYDLENVHNTKPIKTPLGTIRILSLNDLIKMKEASGRPQDLEDVKALNNL